jgi:hypothetical protein
MNRSELVRLVRTHGLAGAALQSLRSAMDLRHVDSKVVVAAVGEIVELKQRAEADRARAAEARDEARSAVARAAAAEAAAHAAGAAAVALGDIAALRAWIAEAPPSPALVSVVIPTAARPNDLERALRSLLAQQHENWEAVVAQQSEGAGARQVVAALDDPRIRLVEHDGPHTAAAVRNTALAAARGEIVAYLDDDCVMDSAWLAVVAWTLAHHPEADVVYGGRFVAIAGARPELHLRSFDHGLFDHTNFMDTNVIAHRAGLPDAEWDESLRYGADWEWAARVTARRPALMVSAIAAVYRTDAEGRLSEEAGAQAGYEQVRRRIAARRPLRVLGFNAMAPLISETYIYEELAALERAGASVAWCRAASAPAPMPVPQQVFTDIGRALREFRPDVLFLHWSSWALSHLEDLERWGVPFGVRAHGFDWDAGDLRRLAAHPLCVGVWDYASSPIEDVPGLHRMGQFCGAALHDWPAPGQQRDLVLCASAGLPKKDWPLLVEAMALLEGTDRRLCLAVTGGFEDEYAKLLALTHELSDPPLVQVNITRREIGALLARTAVAIYTLVPEARFSEPMSVVDALAMGASVVVPDRPEALAFAGPYARGYRDAGQLAGHVREVLAGGAGIEREWAANLQFGRERFCDAEYGSRFLAQLRAGLAGVRNGHAPTRGASVPIGAS